MHYICFYLKKSNNVVIEFEKIYYYLVNISTSLQLKLYCAFFRND